MADNGQKLGTESNVGTTSGGIFAGSANAASISISSGVEYTSSVGSATSIGAGLSSSKVLESSVLYGQNLGASAENIISIDSLTPTNADTAATVTDALGSAATVSDTQLAARYSDGSNRLVSFSYNNGKNDEQNRAYLQIKGETNLFEQYLATAPESSASLKTIFEHLKSRYTSLIILSMQENLQEKQNIMTTIGDSFAATFAGKEPQVMVISGLLPIDENSDTSLSWYTAFVNAFKYFIRASKLAKYRCYVRLVFPQLAMYNIYPTSLSCSITSEQDNLIPFNMTAIVVDNPVARAYNFEQAAALVNKEDTGVQQTVADVKKEQSEATKESEKQSGVTKDPKDVGTSSSKKNFFQSVQEGINKFNTEVNNVMKSKTVQNLNKAFQVINVTKGAVNILKNGTPYGQRNLSSISGGVSSKYRG